MDPSPNRFDALLDNTSSDARPAPSEQYDRSRASDRRDDTRAADDRTAATARSQDARAADRQQAADDRSAAQAADATQAQQNSDKAAAAKVQWALPLASWRSRADDRSLLILRRGCR